MNFSIERMEFQGRGLALVVGRCCGDTMKTGDQAKAMVHQSFNDRGEPTILASEPISIAMPEFLVFDEKQDTLHSGMTGGFLLRVELATGLRLGWFLQGENI